MIDIPSSMAIRLARARDRLVTLKRERNILGNEYAEACEELDSAADAIGDHLIERGFHKWEGGP